MRFGSVCSGIEAASVAWHPLGWKAAWLSEIEPFPSAVLAHHYPDVPNLWDMTTLPERILSGEVEAPDLFCGGTPCQAFSVAGLRNSLDDARGNLSLTFVGIANAIDHVRAVRSASPAIIFWENVPGVLSTKDNAFGCFLAALAGEDDPIVPSGEKWTNAGCVYGPQRAVAWRVLDAQYFGVAQRRRRVFVVASARDDFDPAAILFEFDGVRRDTAPSREARKTVAGGVEIGPGGGRFTDLNPTLDTRAKDGPIRNQLAGAVMQVAAPHVSTHRMVAFGEYSDDGTASAMKARDYKDATDLVAQPMVFDTTNITSPANGSNPQPGDPCFTLAKGQHAPLLAQPIPLNSMNVLRSADADPTTGCGIGEAGEAMFTITKGNHHAVAQPIAFSRNDDGGDATNDLSPTMRVAGRAGGMLGVAQPIAFDAYNQKISDTTAALRCAAGGVFDNTVMQPISIQDVRPVEKAQNGKGWNDDGTAYTVDTHATQGVANSMQVRRLTPVECERLQGFPDNYTNIPWRKKPEAPDGPRYKALGNSWAVPVVRWIGKRIQEALNAP